MNRNRGIKMYGIGILSMVALVVSSILSATPCYAASNLSGQVLGGGAPIANSTVTLWAASAGSPTKLAQARTGKDGRFTLKASKAPGKDATLYLVAKGGQSAANKAAGDNPAIALMTVIGSKLPAKVVINEMTTVASVSPNGSCCTSRRAIGITAVSSAKATAPSRVNPSRRRSTLRSTSRTGSGSLTARSTSSVSRRPTRARP